MTIAPAEALELTRRLDAMTHDERVRATRSWPRAMLRAVFDAALASPPATLEDLVPRALAPLQIVRHVGTNNLPLFRAFEKPMYRDHEGRVCGRNDQLWEPLVGSGYFTAVLAEDGLRLDYRALPREAPAGWPPIHGNRRGLSFFVFRDLCDLMRKLGRHVLVGKATRGGKDLPQYFVLVRAA